MFEIKILVLIYNISALEFVLSFKPFLESLLTYSSYKIS